MTPDKVPDAYPPRPFVTSHSQFRPASGEWPFSPGQGKRITRSFIVSVEGAGERVSARSRRSQGFASFLLYRALACRCRRTWGFRSTTGWTIPNPLEARAKVPAPDRNADRHRGSP